MATPVTVEEYAAELAKRDATIAQLTALTAAQAAKLEEPEALVLRRSAELSRSSKTELSPFAPRLTGWQRHAVTCPACGHRTRAHYDDDVLPKCAFGPRLMAVVVMLTGVYHLSRRDTARLLRERLGLRISTGSVSNIELKRTGATGDYSSPFGSSCDIKYTGRHGYDSQDPRRTRRRKRRLLRLGARLR